MQILTAEAFTDKLRKGNAMLLTQHYDPGPMVLLVRGSDVGEEPIRSEELYYGPQPRSMSRYSYQLFLLEVLHIIKHKGA